jgi:hypothetical protein
LPGFKGTLKLAVFFKANIVGDSVLQVDIHLAPPFGFKPKPMVERSPWSRSDLFQHDVRTRNDGCHVVAMTTVLEVHVE